MRIAEIFYSIQGEGRLLGMPSVFIRTSGCNLRCVWCDTPYTSWRPEGREWSVGEILREACKYPARHVERRPVYRVVGHLHKVPPVSAGIEHQVVTRIAAELKESIALGVQVAVVI